MGCRQIRIHGIENTFSLPTARLLSKELPRFFFLSSVPLDIFGLYPIIPMKSSDEINAQTLLEKAETVLKRFSNTFFSNLFVLVWLSKMFCLVKGKGLR